MSSGGQGEEHDRGRCGPCAECRAEEAAGGRLVLPPDVRRPRFDPAADDADGPFRAALRTIPRAFAWVSWQAREVRSFAWWRDLEANVDAWLTRPSIVLLGETGAGKTIMAILLLLALVDRARVTTDVTARRKASGARFIPERDICPVPDTGISPRHREALAATVLILDDLGKAIPDAGWERALRIDRTNDVLERRYNDGLPTIATLGITRAVAGGVYSGGTERRLFDIPGALVLDLPNRVKSHG